jgi:hypothetical protein
MKKLWLMLVMVGLTASWLHAQEGHSLRINGFGGFGYGFTQTSSTGSTFSTRDLGVDLGVDASGFLYDPRLLGYNFNAFWGHNNNAVDQGSSTSRGLELASSVTFLPTGAYPVSFYFNRGTNNSGGELAPTLSDRYTSYGLTGAIKKPKIATITYNLGTNRNDNEVFGAANDFVTVNRHGDIAANRRLAGWDLRLGESFNRTNSEFASFLQSNNEIDFQASRQFLEKIRVDLGASDSTLNFKDYGPNTNPQSQDNVALLNANVSWKHTKKLDTNYQFSYDRNTVNVIQLLSLHTGVTNPLPPQPLFQKSSSENAGAGISYRAASNVSLHGNASYSHNGLPEQTQNQPQQVLSTITTGVFNVSGGYHYRHPLWKLIFDHGADLGWQHFALFTGGSDSGLSFSLDNRLSGGDVRRVQFGVYDRFSRRANPVFFNLLKNTDNSAGVNFASNYLRFMDLQGSAEYGITHLDQSSSNLDLKRENFSFSAALPRQKLSLYASRIAMSSDELLFGPGSLLFQLQPGGATGAIQIPAQLLVPNILSETNSDRIGLNWRPKSNLEIESQYSKSTVLMNFRTHTEDRYTQFETRVQYKFGRFTIYAGYGRILSGVNQIGLQSNRVLFRIRFPFHIL